MDYCQAADRLRSQDHILIISHRRPDGDTIGCAVALCIGLRNLGKTAYVLPNEDAHELFQPYLENVLAPKEFIPSYVVTVDTAALDLLPDNAKPYAEHIDLALDHHGSNTLYAKESCVTPKDAACGELLFRILKELNVLSPEIAMYLYIAISTDTGCFMFSNTTGQTHIIVAELMELGCNYQWVNKRHFRTRSISRLKLEGMLVQQMALFE